LARGQLSVEFFLIVAFVLVLATMLLSNVEAQLNDTKDLNRAATAKAAVAEVSHAVNAVALQGTGAMLNKEVFVPPETSCFSYNATAGALQCDTGKNIVSGPALVTAPNVSVSCARTGWMTAQARNEGGANVSVYCIALG